MPIQSNIQFLLGVHISITYMQYDAWLGPNFCLLGFNSLHLIVSNTKLHDKTFISIYSFEYRGKFFSSRFKLAQAWSIIQSFELFELFTIIFCKVTAVLSINRWAAVQE